MKRKVAKIGPSTLMVSLPSKWAKLNNIQKGDEVDIKEDQNSLIISTEKQIKVTKVDINITNLSSSLIWNYMKSIYRQGTDEIKVFFDDQKIINLKTNKKINTRELIQIISNELIGMEIIKEEKNYCILKEISDIKEQEFENILNRIFISLTNMFESSIEAIKRKDKQTMENLFTYTDANINKLTDFCMRILNKKQYKDSNSFYIIIVYLEEIGDYIVRMDKSVYKNMAIKKNVLEIYEETCLVLKLLYKTFYKFNKENLLEFYEKRNKIRDRIEKIKERDHALIIKIMTNLMMEIINTKITMKTSSS